MRCFSCFPAASLLGWPFPPGQKGSAKCCAIGRESKGQVGDRRKGRGGPQEEIRILSPPPPHFVRLAKGRLPSPPGSCSHHSPSGLGACHRCSPALRVGWDMGLSHRFRPTGLSACTRSFVQSSSKGRGRSVPAFPRLCTVPLPAGSRAGRRRGRQPGTQAMSTGGGGGGGCPGQGCWLVLWGLVVIEQCGMPETESLWGKLVLSGAAWMFPHL